ncbi:MAG TPA: hypothetical protein VFZ66_18575 [Herpetosiphonaceae bacterium]
MFAIIDAHGRVAQAGRVLRPRYLLSLVAAMFAVYLAVLHPWLLRWGATAAEQQMILPGDELAQPSAVRATRAVTIDAPPEKIWPWLLQIGQDRSGFYSYTWLENLALAAMPEVHEIRPEWQQRQIGDRVPMARQDVFGGPMRDVTTLPVDVLQPGQAIGHLPCVYVLQPIDARSTRLLCREYNTMPLLVRWLLWDPMHFTVERRMMLGIKALAEGRVYPQPALAIPARIGWAAVGIGVLGLFLAQRRRWPWLLVPSAVAAPVLLTTGNADGALAGFLAVGITLLGALLWGRRWWPPFSLIAALVLLVLLVTPEAYVAFGLIFDLLILLAIAVALGSRQRHQPAAMRGPTPGAV